LADPGAEATIAAGDDVVTADEVGIAGDALRDQLRVLNEIRFRLDDPGNNDLALRQLDLLEQGPFMRVARVRSLELDRRWPRCKRDIDDLGEWHVAMVRPLVIAPAQMHPHALRRDRGERMIQRLDMEPRPFAEFLDRQVGILDVPAHRQVGAVDLQGDPGRRNRLVFTAHRLRDREQVRFLARVVVVAEEQRYDAWRGGAEECTGGVKPGEGLSGYRCRQVARPGRRPRLGLCGRAFFGATGRDH